MSDWIDEESEKRNKAKAEIERKAEIIAISNYWLSIYNQVSKDVEKLNQNSIWSDLLKPFPLRVVSFGDHYQIQRTSSTKAEFVSISHNGDSLEFIFVSKGEAARPTRNEVWKVDARDNVVVLLKGKEILSVPEQVSKHLLAFFIEILDEEKNR